MSHPLRRPIAWLPTRHISLLAIQSTFSFVSFFLSGKIGSCSASDSAYW